MPSRTSFTLNKNWIRDNENTLEAGVQCTIIVDLPDKTLTSGTVWKTTHWDVYIESETYGFYKLIAEKSQSKTFTFTIPETFYNEINTSDVEGFLIRAKGYFYETMFSDYVSTTRSTFSIDMKVPETYKPKLSLGTAYPNTNGYNGKFIAGISDVCIPYTLTHNNPKDTINIEEPVCRYSMNGYYVNADTKKDFFLSGVLDGSEQDYSLTFDIKVSDDRKRSVELKKEIYIYGYRLPSYNQQKSWVSRCDASGRVDGLGGYAKLHIELTCSPIDGTNSINSITVKKGNQVLTPVSGSISGGTLEYFMQIPVTESADLEITITDKLATNTVTSFSVPLGTMPLSLFDDGSGTGAAFGQMATKHGVWFYQPLIFRTMINNKYEYFELTCNEYGMVMARKRISEVDKTCTVVIEPIGPYAANTYGTIYTNYAIGQEYKPKASFNGNTITLNLNLGDVINFRYFYDGDYGRKLALYEDEICLGEAEEVARASWDYVVEGNAHLCIKNGEIQPQRKRKIVTVRAEGVSSGYSLWDEGNVHSALNESLVYRVVPGEKIKLNGTSVGREVTCWTIGSSTYYSKELQYTVNSDVTIVAHFEEMINVDVTFFSGRSGYIEIKDKNNATLFDWLGDNEKVNKIIAVPKGSTITITFESMDTFLCKLDVNGTIYQENKTNMTKTITINEPTTIVAECR